MHPPVCRFGLLVLVLAAFLPAARAAKNPDPDSPLVKVAEYHMTHARRGAAVAALGDYIYIFGGADGMDPIYEAERLNIHTGKVELLPVRFLQRWFHGVVEHEGKFHLIGGRGHPRPGHPQEDRMEIYDPVTNTVTQGGLAPNPRVLAAVAKLGNEALIVGGARLNQAGAYTQTNEAEIYEPATGNWRPAPPMPTPRAGPAVVVGQFILVPGGYATRNALKDVEMFVPQEQVWKKLPGLSVAIAAHSAAFLGRWLFLFGDETESDLMLAYELSTRKTVRLKPGPAHMRYSAAVAHNDRLYVVGGADVDATAIGDRRFLDTRSGRNHDLIQVFALNPDYKPR